MSEPKGDKVEESLVSVAWYINVCGIDFFRTQEAAEWTTGLSRYVRTKLDESETALRLTQESHDETRRVIREAEKEWCDKHPRPQEIEAWTLAKHHEFR